MSEEFRDKIGNIIREGSYIVYGSGRSELLIGKVLKIEFTKTNKPWPTWKIVVMGTDIKYGGQQPYPNTKPSILEFPSRIVGISANILSDDILKVLN